MPVAVQLVLVGRGVLGPGALLVPFLRSILVFFLVKDPDLFSHLLLGKGVDLITTRKGILKGINQGRKSLFLYQGLIGEGSITRVGPRSCEGLFAGVSSWEGFLVLRKIRTSPLSLDGLGWPARAAGLLPFGTSLIAVRTRRDNQLDPPGHG